MRSWILPVFFCIFLFFLPLQCFIIGDGMGAGIQGALYRYQITSLGESLITVMAEFMYVFNGAITGKTAYSIILWTIGTIIFTITTVVSLILWNQMTARHVILFLQATALAGIFYLLSLIIQYSILLSGPAGISLPVGILMIFIFVGSAYHYKNWFLE